MTLCPDVSDGVTVSSLWTFQTFLFFFFFFYRLSLIEMSHKYDSAECCCTLGSAVWGEGLNSGRIWFVCHIVNVCCKKKNAASAESTIFIRQSRNPLLCGIGLFPQWEGSCGLSLRTTSPFGAHWQRKYYSVKEISRNPPTPRLLKTENCVEMKPASVEHHLISSSSSCWLFGPRVTKADFRANV